MNSNKSLQKEFVYKIIGKTQTQNKQIRLYKTLVFNGHHSFVVDVFPMYATHTKPKTLDNIVECFIKSAHTSKPFVYDTLKNFVQFISTTKLETRAFAKEIINLEYNNLRIFNLPYKVRVSRFDWHKRYKLGINTKLIKNLYQLNTQQPQDKPIRQTSYLLLYKDTNYDCRYITITKFLYQLLSLKNNQSILHNVTLMATKHKLNATQTKELLLPILQEYTQQGILSTITI